MTDRTISIDDPAAFTETIAALSAGECVIIPTDTVYGLAMVAGLPGGAVEIARRKGRPEEQPLAVLVADMAQAEHLMVLTDDIRLLIAQHWPGQLTVVGERTPAASALDLGAHDATIGVRCPDHDWLRSLAAELGPIAATSANRSGEVPATNAAECRAAFGPDLLIVDAGSLTAGASTVVQVDPLVVLRRGAVEIEPNQ